MCDDGAEQLKAWYRRYDEVCNGHRFDALEAFHRGTFRGVPPTGRPVTTQEFAMYRVENGRIAEVWVTADNAALLT